MVSVSEEQIRHFQELTHELSGSVGLVMNQLVLTLNPKLTPEEVLDHVLASLEVSIRGTTALHKLMWELGLIAEAAGVRYNYQPPRVPPAF